jgi:hypothetical protein
MTKTAIAKKATKTTPALNRANPALALDNPRPRTPTRSGPDVAQSTPCHTEKIPAGSTTAAATEPRTRGDSQTSRTVPPASIRALSSRTGAPSPSSRCSQSSSQRNRARDPNPLRSDSAATHPSPFDFLPCGTGNKASAAARPAQQPITPDNQGGTSRARPTGSSRCDHRDHISTGRNDTMALPSRRPSPSESQRPSVKGKARQVSPQRSQLAKLVEQLGKSRRKIATPEPATAQMSPRALEQAWCVLQVIEADTHSREHTASGSTFSISPAAMLELLANEFNNHDLEDGRYATPQHRQESENSPVTTGEFNRMLNTAVHKVCQPRADEETSSAYVRRRAAQERLSQSAPTLRERVKPEPVVLPVVDSEYYRAQQHLAWWNEEFHN